MGKESSASGGGGVGIVWLVSIILGIIIMVSLDSHSALIDNSCFSHNKPFKQADRYIPNVVEYEADFAWYSNDANLTETHDLGKYKLNSLMAGFFNFPVGIISYTTYPSGENASTCLDAEGKYKAMSTALMVFWIIDIVLIAFICCCVCGLAAASD